MHGNIILNPLNYQTTDEIHGAIITKIHEVCNIAYFKTAKGKISTEQINRLEDHLQCQHYSGYSMLNYYLNAVSSKKHEIRTTLYYVIYNPEWSILY